MIRHFRFHKSKSDGFSLLRFLEVISGPKGYIRFLKVISGPEGYIGILRLF